MTYYPNESVGLAHPVGAEGMTFQCGDAVECHNDPPTCGCPDAPTEPVAEHTCARQEFDHTPQRVRAATCPRCQQLREETR